MAEIITATELASYLERPLSDSLSMKADLANDIVSELPYVNALGEPPYPARMKAITLEVAARAVRNPDGYSSETIDDYTYRRDADTRQAGIYLTDAERTELLGIGGATQGSFFTIGIYSPLDVT